MIELLDSFLAGRLTGCLALAMLLQWCYVMEGDPLGRRSVLGAAAPDEASYDRWHMTVLREHCAGSVPAEFAASSELGATPVDREVQQYAKYLGLSPPECWSPGRHHLPARRFFTVLGFTIQVV